MEKQRIKSNRQEIDTLIMLTPNTLITLIIIAFFIMGIVGATLIYFITENIELRKQLSELDRCSDTLQQCFDTVEEREKQELIRNAFENAVKDTYQTGIGATLNGDDGQLQYYRDSEYCKNFEPKRSNNLDISFYGTSMLPTLRPDADLYGVKAHWNKDLVEGDIVVLDTGDNMYLVHRVFSVYPEYFITKGDNNVVADSEHWTTDKVEYVVCGVVWS